MKAWPPLLSALALLLVLAHDAGAQDARTFIQETADEVFVILKDNNVPSAKKINQLEQIAYARFDFATMARLVMARNWGKLTPEQQTEFVQEFKRHLSVTYGKNIESYGNERIVITGDREETRGDWTVKTKVIRGSEEYLVDYRLRKIDGQWKIIDVVIERVSLVANFRSQLQDVVTNKGAAEMLRMLREKNASGQSILPDNGKVSPGTVGQES